MLEKVKETVAEALGADIDTITAETSFKEDLGADSLDLFEMVMAFEEHFGVDIPAEDLELSVMLQSIWSSTKTKKDREAGGSDS